jgi:hypothetical protein
MESKPFSVKIRQQPIKGRRCAFSEVLTGSYLSPYLILQLDDTPTEGRMYIAKVVLYSADATQNMSIVVAPSRSNSRQPENIDKDFAYHSLIGETVVPGTIYHDPETGTPQIFFIFQQLSVRIQGNFRLLCTVIDVTRYSLLISANMDSVSVFSNPFVMYLPKMFPGIEGPTDLTKSLSIQGLKIFNRKFKRHL